MIRIAHPYPVKSTEITSEARYFDRRWFLRTGVAAAGLALAGCDSEDPSEKSRLTQLSLPTSRTVKTTNTAGTEHITAYEDITHYNNFYEFGASKTDPARNAATLQTRPWSVIVDGECESPGVINLEDLMRPHALEERIYRHRCVEAWSLVAPWVGFSLGDLLKRFKPMSKAKYVSFQTLLDKRQMPETARGVLDFPYRDGLRIDEALHPLAFLSVGLYGRVLPNQNGAPLRLTIPWKYGFKSIKSIVRIRFTEGMPTTTWNQLAPNEYGFYANVNPTVDHPRWSQMRERRLGELFKRETLMFNGYPEVAPLYAGMDLRVNF